MSDGNSRIEEEIALCRDKIKDLEAELKLERTVLRRLERLLPGSKSASKDTNNTTSTAKKGTIEYYIFELLSHGMPMGLSEITKALENMGVKSKSEKGLKPTVAATLSRKGDIFVNAAGVRGIYTLREDLLKN